MQQKKINYVLAKASEGANKYPIEDVLARFGVKTQVRGTQAWFVCPVCGKEKYDYCSATIKGHGAGWWCCQACKTGGGTFRLYALLKGCSDTDALLSLGVLSGTISNEEYEEVTGTEDSRSKLKADEAIRRKIAEKKATSTVERKAPIKIVDYVYRKMLSMDQFTLSKEGYDYLRNRNISDDEIKKTGIFTYNDKFSIKELLNIISMDKYKVSFDSLDNKQRKGLYDSLWGIPGFYYQYNDNSKQSGVWKFVHPSPECVGIPIKNGDGLISALQMRQLKDTASTKYFYVSSRKYHMGEKTNYGSSPGTPVAVLYPDEIKGKTFYVTEGVFKGNELKKFGNVCFSVQGVNAFYYVADEISETLKSSIYKERGGMGAEKVVLVFDADSMAKWQVLQAAVKAAANISRKTGLPTYVMYWNPKLGKGFDDMKFHCEANGMDYVRELRVIEWRQFSDYARDAEKDADAYFKQVHGREPETADRTDKEWGNYLYFYLYEVRLK